MAFIDTKTEVFGEQISNEQLQCEKQVYNRRLDAHRPVWQAFEEANKDLSDGELWDKWIETNHVKVIGAH